MNFSASSLVFLVIPDSNLVNSLIFSSNTIFKALYSFKFHAELNQENNGKASVLNETIRLMKEMFCNIQSLRKENATLLSESQYVSSWSSVLC